VAAPAAAPAAEWARLVFDATRDGHGLGAWERELLGFAAQLAGIGMHIDYYNRDRHAEYLVHSGDLRGFTHREIVILAALVRWADEGTPDLSAYRALLENDDQRRTAVLAAILGVARAIDRRGAGTVGALDVKSGRGKLALRLHGHDALAPELLEIERQAKRFESVLLLQLAAERAG
jgi:exopolyphosphatase / guanosine-5'-triphosphate,3'-diphosphate pyrophosphatase